MMNTSKTKSNPSLKLSETSFESISQALKGAAYDVKGESPSSHAEILDLIELLKSAHEGNIGTISLKVEPSQVAEWSNLT